MYEGAEEESEGYAEEDTEDYLNRFVVVEIVAKGQGVAVHHLEHRQCEACAKEFEDHRNRRRSGHAEAVEDVEQNDVRDHHRDVNNHHIFKREVGGMEDAVAGNVHHPVGKQATRENADGRHPNDGAIFGRLRADGRVEEVDSVVAHANIKVEGGEDKETNDNSEKQSFHKVEYSGLSFRCKSTLPL